MDFWQMAQAFVSSHEIMIDRPCGSHHPRFPEFIYPLDYGYLQNTRGGDGQSVDIWKGSLTENKVVGVVGTLDSKKSDAELKLLVACTEAEIQIVESFYQDNQFMCGLLIRRPL
jgi:inorganic pyrophosphatase